MAHKHRSDPRLERTQCYSSQVAYGEDAEPRAHGGVCFHQQCACGARRFVNANGKFVERGEWFGPTSRGAALTPVARAAAETAAREHLAAIRWAPEQGMEDKALGLGEEAWGGPEAWQSGRAWTVLCESRVRRVAAELSSEVAIQSDRAVAEARAEACEAIREGATAPWGDGELSGYADLRRELQRGPLAGFEGCIDEALSGYRTTFLAVIDAEAPRAEVES